jgi:FKBP-type peptidyl-prolyl cis-trans isomerase FkpA
MRTGRLLAAIVAAVSLGTACVESPNVPSHFATFSTFDLVVGGGEQAGSAQTVTVHYTGWLYDETQPEGKGARFDTSRGGDPVSFIIGGGQVILGFELGVPGMRIGGLRRIVVPPSLGYGESRVGQIPPNATLLFEVELLAIN